MQDRLEKEGGSDALKERLVGTADSGHGVCFPNFICLGPHIKRGDIFANQAGQHV